MAINVNNQLADSSVFDMVNDAGGPIIPSVDDVSFKPNLDKEMGPPTPIPGKGAIDKKSLDAGDIFYNTPGLEQLFQLDDNQLVDDMVPGGEVGPETGEQQDPSPDNDFWTGPETSLYSMREEAKNWFWQNFGTSTEGSGISTFFNKFGSNPGSDGLEEYFDERFTDQEYVLSYLGGLPGPWQIANEMPDGTDFDPAEGWRKFIEWYHVWGINNPYYDDMTEDEYQEIGGPLDVYEYYSDIYGTDPNNWNFAPEIAPNGEYQMNLGHGLNFARTVLYADYANPHLDIWEDPDGVYTPEEPYVDENNNQQFDYWEEFTDLNNNNQWDAGEEWDDQSLPGNADAWNNDEWDEGETWTDVAQYVGQVGQSINVFMEEVVRRENDYDPGSNPYAPDYWEYVYHIAFDDIDVSANDLVDDWIAGNWEEVFGPFIANLGITAEEFMNHYGAYLEPYDVTVPQDLRSGLEDIKNESRAQAHMDLEEARVNMVKSGFTESYQHVESLNELLANFDATINMADYEAEQAIDNYNESWQNGFIDTMTELAEMGAFEIETWWDLLEETSETGDAQEAQEDMPPPEQPVKGTGFTQHYA